MTFQFSSLNNERQRSKSGEEPVAAERWKSEASEGVAESETGALHKRIALLVEYCGGKFSGSQYQVGVRTVQGELESALSTYLRRQIGVIFAGRTDAGVHADGQVVHFDFPKDDPKGELNLWELAWGVNGILPKDMAVVSAQFVDPNFHARFSATARRYVYRILNRPQRSASLRDTHYWLSHPLNVEKMMQAIPALIGDHDFAAFKSTNADTVTSQCQVHFAELLNLGEGQLEFWIEANHFVYNMVRIIVGTLIEIGLGKKSPESLEIALKGKDRSLAGPTAPPWGLCLKTVTYPEAFEIFASESSKMLAASQLRRR